MWRRNAITKANAIEEHDREQHLFYATQDSSDKIDGN